MRVAIMAWGGRKYFGVWNYYLNLARVLRVYEPNIRVCLFVPREDRHALRSEVEEATHESVYELPETSRLSDVAGLLGYHDREFARCFAAAQIDVVFEQAKFLGRKFPIAVLPWIGDLQHRTLPHYFSRLHRLQRDIGFWSQTRWRKHVVVSSNAAREDLLRLVDRPRAKIHVVPFAVRATVEIDELSIAQSRQKYELVQPYLFLPNQLWRHKDHATAFRALHRLVASGFTGKLVLSGQPFDYRHPEYSKELAKLSAELHLEEHLRWLGAIPYEDLLNVLAGADVVLNPSLFEGWSTTVEEAKSLGVPLVLSGIDVHREQAPRQARFFTPGCSNDMAEKIGQILSEKNTDRAFLRATAQQENLKAQQIFAERIARAISEAYADHRRDLAT